MGSEEFVRGSTTSSRPKTKPFENVWAGDRKWTRQVEGGVKVS